MIDGTALIYCEGALGTPRGRIANNLLRFSRRYHLLGVLDSNHAGRAANEVVGQQAAPLPIFADLSEALNALPETPKYLVIGLDLVIGLALGKQEAAPPGFRATIRAAIRQGLSVDSAHRPFLHDDAEFPQLAMIGPARLRSIGYPKRISALHRYTGELQHITAPRVAIISTADPVGIKNLMAWLLAAALEQSGVHAEIIGTTETSWFQGVKYCALLDTAPRSYVSGELEAVIVQAARESQPQAFLLEGSGSPLHQAHPTGWELLTTAQPSAVVLQHTPNHPDFPARDPHGIEAVLAHLRLLAALPGAAAPVAIALNRLESMPQACATTHALLAEACSAPVYEASQVTAGPLAAWLIERLGLPDRTVTANGVGG